MATDLTYDIEVSKDKSSIQLKVELPPRIKARDPIVEFNNRNAVDVLRDKGMLEGYTLDKDASSNRLSNWYENSLAGTWVFVRDTPASTEKTSTSSSTTSTATVPVESTSSSSTQGTKSKRTKRSRTKVTTTESTS